VVGLFEKKWSLASFVIAEIIVICGESLRVVEGRRIQRPVLVQPINAISKFDPVNVQECFHEVFGGRHSVGEPRRIEGDRSFCPSKDFDSIENMPTVGKERRAEIIS